MTRSKRKKSQKTTSDDNDDDEQQQRNGGLKVFASSYRLATYDVMCGRNKVAEAHRGNKRFRALIETHCRPYMNDDTTREERRLMVTHILDQVMGKGGYFLKQDYEGGEFMEISIKYAREKIVHSLRDTYLKLQSMVQVPVTTKETPCTKAKPAVPSSKKNSMTVHSDRKDVASIATTNTEESERDSTTSSKAHEQVASEGEVSFQSYQSNVSTLEGIDECRIRRIRHSIDCKPRKKPKQSGTYTKNPKKSSSLAHRPLGSKLPAVPTAKPDNRTIHQSLLGTCTNPTPKGNGLDTLATHRALVLAAMQAEQARRRRESSPTEMAFQSSSGRIVTPQQGRSFMAQSSSSNIVQADSSALAAPRPAFHDFFNAPSSSVFSKGVAKGPSTTQLRESDASLPSIGTKRQHLLPPLTATNSVSVSQRKDTRLTTTCRSDISSPHTKRHSSHALVLEETEDERISCWGDYC